MGELAIESLWTGLTAGLANIGGSLRTTPSANGLYDLIWEFTCGNFRNFGNLSPFGRALLTTLLREGVSGAWDAYREWRSIQDFNCLIEF